MNQSNSLLEKWNQAYEKIRPGVNAAGKVIYNIGLWIFRLRALFLAIPVIIAALRLARVNYELLPEMVGLNIQTTGEYTLMVTKEVAVYGPLAVTLGCLLMVLLSRKTLYPWLVSVLTLVLPILIYVTNVFPA